MTQQRETEKVWLKDEQGNYYMLTREMLEQIKVPQDHKAEVEKVIAGQDDAAGFSTFGATQLGSFSLAGSSLSVLGRCMCGRNFGVQTLFRR